MSKPPNAPVPTNRQARGQLVLAATPIGNVSDASDRLRELLATADVVAAEDTRKTRDLARRLGVEISGRVVSCFEHNEDARAAQLLDAVAEDALVVLVSDAGMPAVSDPGYRMVAQAVARDMPVTVAPGPSAVLAALALSGLPSDRFVFEGFLPRKPGERGRALAALADEPRTLVFFESPHRIGASLQAAIEAFGADRSAALCRELTKTYEEVLRGPLADLAAEAVRRDAAGNPLRGELVLVVAGASAAPPPNIADLVTKVGEQVTAGVRLKQAATDIAAQHGVSRRELYNACLTSLKPLHQRSS